MLIKMYVICCKECVFVEKSGNACSLYKKEQKGEGSEANKHFRMSWPYKEN